MVTPAKPPQPRFNLPDTPRVLYANGNSYPVTLLAKAQEDAWRDAVEFYARSLWNPMAELAERVKVLPPELRETAIKAAIARKDFGAIPATVRSAAFESLFSTRYLVEQLTGSKAEIVTAANLHDVLS